MSDSDSSDLFDDDDEHTAIVRLGSIARVTPVPPRDRFVLVQVKGEELGRVIRLEAGELVIGRHPTCGLVVVDGGVSRRHARIKFVDGRHLLDDLGSANGTYVSGERVDAHWLSDGDVIQFGSNVEYRYSVTDSQQLAMLQYLYDASVTDALTGAFNREYFDGRLATEIAYATRHGTALSLLMLDIDHFKRVNDDFGHQVGDSALVKMVESVRTKLRVEDVFCRYGGEEFAAILRTTDLEAARSVAERVRQAVAVIELKADGRSVPLTVSIGCASLSCTREATCSELVAAADRRLYLAKRSGRNCVIASD